MYQLVQCLLDMNQQDEHACASGPIPDIKSRKAKFAARFQAQGHPSG